MNRGLINKISKNLTMLSYGLAMIELSLIYVNDAGVMTLNSPMLLNLMVAGIFGFFHSVHKLNKNQNEIQNNSVFMWLSLTLIYGAWYNIVLLPPSGFWLFEVVMIASVLFSDFIMAVSGKKIEKIAYVSSSQINLLIMGAILFIGKVIIIVLFPQNLYIEHFVGNETARLFILLLSLLGFIMVFSSIVRKFKCYMGITQKTISSGEKIFKKIGKLIKAFFKFVLSLLTGWALIVVILLLCFAAGFIIFSVIRDTADNIMEFVEPILINLTDTGKNAITDSVIYYLSQFTVLIAVLIYSIKTELSTDDEEE